MNSKKILFCIVVVKGFVGFILLGNVRCYLKSRSTEFTLTFFFQSIVAYEPCTT